MNHSFEYIDIILLAMIAGFIFLRLRGILGKRTGYEENVDSSFSHEFSAEKKLEQKLEQSVFDETAKENFLKGAKIRTTKFFSDNYLVDIKVLLNFVYETNSFGEEKIIDEIINNYNNWENIKLYLQKSVKK